MIEPVFSFSSANTFFVAQLDLILPLQSELMFQSVQQFEQAAVSLFRPLLLPQYRHQQWVHQVQQRGLQSCFSHYRCHQ